MMGCTINPVMGAAAQKRARLLGDAPSVSKIRLVFAFCNAKPNCIPKKPKLIFQICQKFKSGLALPDEAAVVGENDIAMF
jgi:hypothetical protein